MDNLSLEALVRELRPRILNKAIQKIRMADERTIVFYLRSDVTERLVVSLHPVAPGLFIAGQNRLVESRTPDAMLTLRKYLVGGKIKQVRKELAERVVFLEIENYRRSNEVERSSLVLEFIPNKVRCWLLDGERNVLAVYPAIQAADREVATPYEPPALKSCYRVDAIQQDQLLELLSIQSSGSNEKQIAGLSPIFVRELVQRGGNDPQAAWMQLEALLNQIRQGPYLPRIYSLESSADNSDSENDKESQGSWGTESLDFKVQQKKNATSVLARLRKPKKIISPVALECMRNADYQEFPSMNDASLAWCQELRDQGARRADLQFQVNRIFVAFKKRLRLKENLEADLARNSKAGLFKQYADLLYAQPDRAPKGASTLRVVNLFDPELNELDIPLDPQLSPIENANRYGRLHQKANRSIPVIQARLKRLQSKIDALSAEAQQLCSDARTDPSRDSAAQAPNTDVKPQSHSAHRSKVGLKKTGQEVSSSSSPKSLLKKVAKSFVSSEGLQILVGRSSKDNDVLTMKIARGEDFWLHAAGYGGAHVVLRNPKKIPEAPKQSLLEAAQLAAYFSQARNAPKVEVHYTQKRFVSKPKGAKPGLVRLKEYRSISARPELVESEQF